MPFLSLFSGFSLISWLKLGAAVIVVTGLVSGYFWVQGIRHQNTAMQSQIVSLTNTVQAEDAIIKQKDSDSKLSAELNNTVAQKTKNAIKGKTATQKQVTVIVKQAQEPKVNAPELQNLLNILTKQSLRCDELVTGAPVTPDDALNTLCQNFIAGEK